MRIGYITHRKGIIGRLGNTYLYALKKYVPGENAKKEIGTKGQI